MERGQSLWHCGAMATDPDLSFCGFSLWVDQRQFPSASDYWDGNWLIVRAQMEANGARIKCGGPFLMTTDIKHFRDGLMTMVNTLAGEATLMGLEPELNLLLKMEKLGHVEGVIEITPDHLNQHHSFTVAADQSYLPALIRGCDAILDRFPVINTDEK